MCKRDWHFKLVRGRGGRDSDEIHFTSKPTASGHKESFSTTYHKTFRKSFSEGGGEASTTLTSTNLRAEEDGMRVLAVSSTLTATLRLCRVTLTRVQKFSSLVEKQKGGFTPEQIHRVCEHGVGRPVNLGVLLHGDAALDEIHGCLQVAEGLAGPVSLRRHSTATRAL